MKVGTVADNSLPNAKWVIAATVFTLVLVAYYAISTRMIQPERWFQSEEGFMLWKEASYEAMRQSIRRACDKFGRTVTMGVEDIDAEFIVDYDHRVALCRNAKVGTNTWLDHFLRLSSLNQSEQAEVRTGAKVLFEVVPPLFELDDRDKRLPMDTVAHRKALLKVSFVRHPFERLVSAFESKITQSNDKSYADLRQSLNSTSDSTGVSLFSAFIQHVLSQNSDCEDRGGGGHVDNCRVDVHWRPFYRRCGYCDVTYDVIGRLETFADDVRYVVLKRNLSALIPHEELTLRKNPTSNGGGQHRWKKYFRDIHKRDFLRLVKFYQPDFEMFGYSYS